MIGTEPLVIDKIINLECHNYVIKEISLWFEKLGICRIAPGFTIIDFRLLLTFNGLRGTVFSSVVEYVTILRSPVPVVARPLALAAAALPCCRMEAGIVPTVELLETRVAYSNIHQRGRGRWAVYYTSPQSFKMFSYSLVWQLRRL